MKRAHNCFSRCNKRSGSVLILVLACCVVAVALVMLSVQASLQQRRHLRDEHQLEQTRWVLDAAIRKSIADPPEKASKIELKPKLDKFDKVSFEVTPEKDDQQVSVRARIENEAGTNVTSRSASFETND
ncbi:hypothetical protein N9Y42_01080 [Mariniblastus sp.]|nr:hypothetical protein [Mariniblastus sp.]